MPRGRQQPPQESIESILLAICRRDDLDNKTLQLYFSRLEEEWSEGAREKVLHLLRSRDAAAHTAAIMILGEVASEEDLEELEDLVTDPTLSDLAKLALVPVLKELGSEMVDEGMVEYLNDPATAMQQMQLRLLELVGKSEMGIESILQDVIAMPLERRLAFITWLGGSNDARAAQLLIPLLENQPLKVATAVVEALEQLGPIAAQQSLPALNYLLSTNLPRTLKQEVRATLGRLMMQGGGSGGTEAQVSEGDLQQLAVHEARTSYLDGSGTQLVMISWKRPDNLLKGVNILFQDQLGIKDCYGVDGMDIERWNSLVQDLQEQGFFTFAVPFDFAREIVLQASETNKLLHHHLPISYVVWRTLLESKRQHSASPVLEIEVRPLNEETMALAESGGELFQLPEFLSWLYDPMERTEPFISRYLRLYNAEVGRRSQKLTAMQEKRLRSLLDELVDEALDELIDEHWRNLFAHRLRKQARLFHLADREHDAQRAGAVASLLDPTSSVSVREQDFLRVLMRLSIEQGPLRMMFASLSDGDGAGAPPITLRPIDNE